MADKIPHFKAGEGNFPANLNKVVDAVNDAVARLEKAEKELERKQNKRSTASK